MGLKPFRRVFLFDVVLPLKHNVNFQSILIHCLIIKYNVWAACAFSRRSGPYSECVSDVWLSHQSGLRYYQEPINLQLDLRHRLKNTSRVEMTITLPRPQASLPVRSWCTLRYGIDNSRIAWRCGTVGTIYPRAHFPALPRHLTGAWGRSRQKKVLKITRKTTNVFNSSCYFLC